MSTAFGIRESMSSPQVNARRPLQVNHEGGVAGAARPPRDRFARLIVRRVVIPLASLALVGCETQRMTSATDPTVPKDTPERTASASELGATAFTTRATATTLGGPLAGLDAEQLARFEAGRTEFMEVDGVREGLGPVFNDASCVTCHNAPVGGTTGRVETRFGLLAGGQFDALERFGGSLLQDHALGEVAAGAGTFTYVPGWVPIAVQRAARPVDRRRWGSDWASWKTVRSPTARFSPAARETRAFLLALDRRQAHPRERDQNRCHPPSAGGVRLDGRRSRRSTSSRAVWEALLNEMGVTNPEFPKRTDPMVTAPSSPSTRSDDERRRHTWKGPPDFMTQLGRRRAREAPNSAVRELESRAPAARTANAGACGD
jgi:hypothetical protein